MTTATKQLIIVCACGTPIYTGTLLQHIQKYHDLGEIKLTHPAARISEVHKPKEEENHERD